MDPPLQELRLQRTLRQTAASLAAPAFAVSGADVQGSSDLAANCLGRPCPARQGTALQQKPRPPPLTPHQICKLFLNVDFFFFSSLLIASLPHSTISKSGSLRLALTCLICFCCSSTARGCEKFSGLTPSDVICLPGFHCIPIKQRRAPLLLLQEHRQATFANNQTSLFLPLPLLTHTHYSHNVCRKR